MDKLKILANELAHALKAHVAERLEPHDRRIRELERQIATLEERIAALEAKLAEGARPRLVA